MHCRPHLGSSPMSQPPTPAIASRPGTRGPGLDRATQAAFLCGALSHTVSCKLDISWYSFGYAFWRVGLCLPPSPQPCCCITPHTHCSTHITRYMQHIHNIHRCTECTHMHCASSVFLCLHAACCTAPAASPLALPSSHLLPHTRMMHTTTCSHAHVYAQMCVCGVCIAGSCASCFPVVATPSPQLRALSLHTPHRRN